MNDLDKLFRSFPLETQRILGFPHIHLPQSYNTVKDKDKEEKLYECKMIYYKEHIIIYLENLGAFFFDDILYEKICNDFKILDSWNKMTRILIRTYYPYASEDDYNYGCYRFFNTNDEPVLNPNTIKGIYLSNQTLRYLFKYPIRTDLKYSLDMKYKYKKPNLKMVVDALSNPTDNIESVLNLSDIYNKNNYKELLNNKKIIHDM